MKNIASILFLCVVLLSCGNKGTKQNAIDWKHIDSVSQVRDSIERADGKNRLDSIIREQEKMKKEQSNSNNSSSSRNIHKVKKDNMRGFDPASEDDMDDNGMSRYMENNDEEGWD